MPFFINLNTFSTVWNKYTYKSGVIDGTLVAINNDELCNLIVTEAPTTIKKQTTPRDHFNKLTTVERLVPKSYWKQYVSSLKLPTPNPIKKENLIKKTSGINLVNKNETPVYTFNLNPRYIK